MHCRKFYELLTFNQMRIYFSPHPGLRTENAVNHPAELRDSFSDLPTKRFIRRPTRRGVAEQTTGSTEETSFPLSTWAGAGRPRGYRWIPPVTWPADDPEWISNHTSCFSYVRPYTNCSVFQKLSNPTKQCNFQASRYLRLNH